MLNALTKFSCSASIIKIPRLYHFNRETNTQVLEDIPSVVDLQTLLISPTANDVFIQSLAASIGRALGSWLRSFHSWISAPLQADLREEIGSNGPMRQLKYLITYGSFIKVLEQFPDVLRDYKKILEDIKDSATKDFERTANDDREEWGVIHGDCWTGK
jgi:hypothetical protein